MRFSFFGFFGVRFVVLAAAATAAIVLPVASSGCGRTACIVFSKAEFDARGSCPLQNEVLPYFSDDRCPGPVVSVDGEGVFTLNEKNADQSLCCYSVTQQDLEFDDQRIDCLVQETGGSGGMGGGGGIGGGVGGSFPGCFTCDQTFTTAFNADPAFLCPESTTAWFDLQACVCSEASTCFSVCELNFCAEVAVSDECVSCVASASDCADLFSGCAFN